MIRRKIWVPLVAVSSASFLFGCSEDPEPAEQADRPHIVSFSASPAQIEEGMWSKLTWETQNATSVRIQELKSGAPVDIGSEKAGKGEVTLYPTTTTAFVLVAAGPGGETSSSTTVQVALPDRPIVSLKANPAKIDFGGTSTLQWEVEGADKMTLYAGTEELRSDDENFAGTLVVEPARTTYYRVVAEGVGGRTQVELPVEVFAVIESFTAAAVPTPIGADVELSWTTAGAEKLIVTNDGGFRKVISPAPASGTLLAPVGPEGRFTLVALLADKETEATAKANVLAPPAISTFTASPLVLTEGAEVPVTLAWDVVRTDRLTLTATPGGPIALDDDALTSRSIAVDVFEETLFELRAENDAGSVTKTVLVQVVAAPVIVEFSASPSTVEAGEEVTLTWETTGGTSFSLLVDGEAWDQPVEPSGTAAFTLEEDTEFVLRVTNAAGTTVESTRTVQIADPGDPPAGD